MSNEPTEQQKYQFRRAAERSDAAKINAEIRAEQLDRGKRATMIPYKKDPYSIKLEGV